MGQRHRGRGFEDLTGIFRTHAPGFRESLLSMGYSPWSVKSKLLILTEINRWLLRRAMAPELFEETKLRGFLQDQNRGYRTVGGVRKTGHQILAYLRSQAALAPVAITPTSAAEQLEEKFAAFLRDERGLAETSTHLYVRVVHSFLVGCTRGQRRFSNLKPADITGYVLEATRRYRTATVKVRLRALRWVLRFLYATGEIPVNLTPAVPKVAQWRQADIPKFIPAADVRRLLEAPHTRSRSGGLDRAVLLLLARLGLRAGEVAGITLADVDWDTGELTVHGKGDREARIPLPVDVGKALARYLRRDRPHSSSRFLFLSPYAPHRPFTTIGISVLVKRAIRRAQIKTPTEGAHLLRHSLATHILRSGGSLPEIADLLRHRSLETTTIYAKVDFKALRAIAPTWPGTKA